MAATKQPSRKSIYNLGNTIINRLYHKRINGAFIKYKDEIENTLAEEEWHGSDLVEVTKEDIKRLGIIMFKDINSLYKHIEKLTMKEGIKKKKHDRDISSNMSNMTISAFEYSKPDISMLVSDGNSVRL